jgi:UDP-3-O-[3-hydroxymyristoyl] glucosamine N-acyltransferase
MPNFTAAHLARHLEGELVGDGGLELTGFAPAEMARPGDLVFAENEAYFTKAERAGGSAILCPPQFTSAAKTLIRVKNPRVAYARVLPLFFPEPVPKPGVHPSAVVAASARVDASAHVGPLCVIGERVKVGARAILLGGNHVGDDCSLGDDVRLYQNVIVYPRSQVGNRVRIHAGTVIGSDGFGYVLDQGQHRKVLQMGTVIIGDDVEIGANAAIDRGALGPTVIGKGTKIDNLVQIAHNVSLGEGCLVVGQAGIAGSTKLGSYVVLAGQVGIAGHLKIGNQVTVAAQSGVMNDIPDGEKWLGSPACPDKDAKRQYIGIRRLPDALRKIGELERKLAALEGNPLTKDGSHVPGQTAPGEAVS